MSEELSRKIEEALRSMPSNFLKLREGWNLSQSAFGKLLASIGVSGGSQSLISDWEKGKRTPTPQAIVAYALAYNVDPKYLLGIETDPQPLYTELDFGDDELEKALEDLRDIDPSRYEDFKEIVIFLADKARTLKTGEPEGQEG